MQVSTADDKVESSADGEVDEAREEQNKPESDKMEEGRYFQCLGSTVVNVNKLTSSLMSANQKRFTFLAASSEFMVF